MLELALDTCGDRGRDFDALIVGVALVGAGSGGVVGAGKCVTGAGAGTGVGDGVVALTGTGLGAYTSSGGTSGLCQVTSRE